MAIAPRIRQEHRDALARYFLEDCFADRRRFVFLIGLARARSDFLKFALLVFAEDKAARGRRDLEQNFENLVVNLFQREDRTELAAQFIKERENAFFLL